MTTKSNWLKMAKGLKTWLFTNGLTGVDLLPSVGSPDIDQMRIRIAKRVSIKKAWVGHKSLHITPSPMAERFGVGGSTEDYIGYSFQVVLIWPSNADDETEADIDDWANWREVVRNQLLPTNNVPLGLTDPQIETIEWEPQAVYDAASFAANYDVQGFTARMYITEPRRVRTL